MVLEMFGIGNLVENHVTDIELLSYLRGEVSRTKIL